MPDRTRAMPLALGILAILAVGVSLAIVRGTREPGPIASPTLPTIEPTATTPPPTTPPPTTPPPTTPPPTTVPPTVEPTETATTPPDGLPETGGATLPWLGMGALLFGVSGALWRLSRTPS